MINNPKYIIVHCTDASSKTFDQFQAVNAYHKTREFPMSSLGYYVGYHVLITGGKAYRAKQDGEEGAHTNQQVDGLSMNFQSLGICMGFDGDIEMPDAYMVPLLKKQIKEWQSMYGIPTSRVMFHRDFQPAKTCPGSLVTRQWLEMVLADQPQPDFRDIEQRTKQVEIQEKINILYKLVDALRRILWEQFGIK